MVRFTMVLAGVLLGGCATVHPFPRAAAPEELERFNAELRTRELSIGVARREGNVVLSYDVETLPARELRLTADSAAWRDPATGVERQAPLQALAWVSWPTEEGSRLTSALKVGGLGLAGGAVLGGLLGFLLGYAPEVCVGGGDNFPGQVGSFASRCFLPWPPKLALGAAIGAGVGAVAGALIGALVGPRERVELTGPVAPPPPPATPEPASPGQP
jgi:hypothetical protein